MLLSLGIASANFFAKLMLDDWLLTMDNMGMKTRVLRAPCWWMMMMTFNGLRVVIPLSWYAEQSPGVTRTCPVLFSTQPVRLSIEPGIIIDKGFGVAEQRKVNVINMCGTFLAHHVCHLWLHWSLRLLCSEFIAQPRNIKSPHSFTAVTPPREGEKELCMPSEATFSNFDLLK